MEGARPCADVCAPARQVQPEQQQKLQKKGMTVFLRFPDGARPCNAEG
eukprot:gene24453-59667_t